jgi:hypothetical protein
MKKKLLVLASIVAVAVLGFGALFAITGYQCCNSAADGTTLAATDRRPSANEAALAAPSERVGFYAVELRCPLVRGLGCGSDSKPIMKKLEANSAVAGTWLNHAGTTLAVFWNDGVDAARRSDTVSEAFQDQERPKELSSEARARAFSDFRSGVAWYRAAAIDELSGQEADAVAARWVDKMNAVVPMPKKFKDALRARLSDEMRCRFVSG